MTKNLEQWQSYIGTSLKKTAEATLETAERIDKFKLDSSESDFKDNMKKWFGFGATHLSYWSKIHMNYERFSSNINIIPSSTRTLYELSSIEDELWNELIQSKSIKPSITVEEAKILKSSGGVAKRLAAKYSDSPDYLEISNKVKELKKSTGDNKELKAEFNKWLKANPPEECEEITEEVKEKEVNPKPKKESRMSIEDAYKQFGIFVDKPIKNLRILKLMHQLSDEDQTGNLERAIEVITGR